MTPDGEVFHGPQGIRKAFARWQGAFEGHHFEIDELREAGDTVVVLFRERGRGRASGVATEQHSGGVWRFRDGKVVRMTPYRDREEALRAAGLL